MSACVVSKDEQEAIVRKGGVCQKCDLRDKHLHTDGFCVSSARVGNGQHGIESNFIVRVACSLSKNLVKPRELSLGAECDIITRHREKLEIDERHRQKRKGLFAAGDLVVAK